MSASAAQLCQEGVALHQTGDLAGAIERYDAALRVDRQNVEALHMRGVVHLQQGEPDLSAHLIERSIALDATDSRAHGNLASAYMALRRYDQAIESARRGVALDPQAPDIWGNLGVALVRRSRYPEALEAYLRAVALQPDRAGFHSAIGLCLGRLMRFEEALESHRRAMQLAPDRPEFRNNISITLRAMKLDAEAEEMLRSAIADGLTDVELRGGLALLLRKRGKLDEALDTYRAARDEGLDSSGLDGVMLFSQNHQLATTPEAQKADAVDWARRAAAEVTPFTWYGNERTGNRPIRVGLVSGDLRGHPVGRFLAAPLAEVDPAVLALYAYSAYDSGDPIEMSLRRAVPHWRSSRGLSDDQLAERIRQDRIDVLVDLSGHTAFNRLRCFLFKPAPVAVTWLGYFATTGMAAIDYVLCNRWLIPAEEEEQWVEKPWRLPSAHWCYWQMPSAPPVAVAPALANGHTTFGCYNNFDKLNVDTIATWSRILDTVPNSRLLLRSANEREHVRARIVDEFSRRGHPVGDRLTVEAATMPYDEHMRSYGHIDVALDPFPYNGGTTTVEALYMGVPVLALRGDRFVGHMAESNIRSAGLDEWVADDVDDYVRRAGTLTADIPGLAALRAQLRDQVLKSPLFDAAGFARQLEQTFTGMWSTWLASPAATRAAGR